MELKYTKHILSKYMSKNNLNIFENIKIEYSEYWSDVKYIHIKTKELDNKYLKILYEYSIKDNMIIILEASYNENIIDKFYNIFSINKNKDNIRNFIRIYKQFDASRKYINNTTEMLGRLTHNKSDIILRNLLLKYNKEEYEIIKLGYI